MRKHARRLKRFFKERVCNRYTFTGYSLSSIILSQVIEVTFTRMNEGMVQADFLGAKNGLREIKSYKTMSDAKKQAPIHIKTQLDKYGLRYNVMELINDVNGGTSYAFSITPSCYKWYKKQRLTEY